jgi:hypothetical protein
MINNLSNQIEGTVVLLGKRAILTENNFYLKKSIRENIIFYN